MSTTLPSDGELASLDRKPAPVARQAAGTSLRVLVWNRAKEPVSGAVVRVSNEGESLVASSGDNGECEFESVVRTGPGIGIEITKSGYAHFKRGCYWADPIIVKLDTAVEIKGQVVTSDGAPIAGAQVETRRMDGDFPDPLVATSNEGGTFTLGPVPDGQNFVLETNAPRFERSIDKLVSGVGVPRVVIVLQPGRQTCGQVVDDVGRLLSSVTVRRENSSSRETLSNERGEFCATDLLSPSESICIVTLTAKGHCTTRAAFAILDGDRPSAPIVMPRSAGVSGITRDEDGVPIAGARITLQRDFGASPASPKVGPVPSASQGLKGASDSYRDELPVFRTTVSGSDGSFEVRGLVPNSPAAVLWAAAPGFESMISTPIELGGPGSLAQFDVTLTSKAMVEKGRRIQGIVELNDVPVEAVVNWRGTRGIGKVVSRSDGQFVIPTAEAKAIVLTAAPLGTDDLQWGASVAGTEVVVDLSSDSPSGIRIRMSAPVQPIECTVRNWHGDGVADCFVEVEAPDLRFRHRGKTNRDGVVLLSRLDAKSEQIVRATVGGISTTSRVLPDSVAVVLTLPRTTRHEVRAINADSGRHIDRCAWFARSGPTGAANRLALQAGALTTTQPGGWLELQVPDGMNELVVIPDPETRSLPGVLRLTEAKNPTQLEVECPTGANLCFRFDPPPPPTCRVLLYPTTRAHGYVTGLTGLSDAFPGEEGIVLGVSPVDMAFLQLIAPGDYKLATDSQEWLISPERITIKPPDTVAILRAYHL